MFTRLYRALFPHSSPPLLSVAGRGVAGVSSPPISVRALGANRPEYRHGYRWRIVDADGVDWYLTKTRRVADPLASGVNKGSRSL